MNQRRNKSSTEPLLNTPSYHGRQKSNQKATRLVLIASALALFGSSCIYLSHKLPTILLPTDTLKTQGLWQQDPPAVTPGISARSFEHGLAQCQFNLDRAQAKTNTTRVRHRNPRRAPEAHDTLIEHAHIWLGDRYLEDGQIYLRQGLIAAVGHDLDVPKGIRRLDAEGRVVTPGLIDMHSHMTVDSLNGLSASDDTNEMTHPTTPYVRVIDALSPTDPAIKLVASGGITTSLILPGSGNLIGGEAAVIKLRPVPTLSNQDMLVSAGSEEEDQEIHWRFMKMACGENPKAFYGPVRNQMPSTRLGEAYLFRRSFEKAQTLMRQQDDWCDAAYRLSKTDKTMRLAEPYPEDLKLESLVALLRKQVNLNVHCYLPQDFEAMIRHSIEFDFEIAAFHHALSAWQVPEIIKRAKNNITIATFADMWGYKAEAMDQNVHAPKILDAAGIPVAFKSDHPVISARDLLFEAQKAYHYGFDEHKALQALTTVPATSLKLNHRIGSIAVGKDADLVIWERHPLRLGARPTHVFVDGAELDFQASWTKSVSEQPQEKMTTQKTSKSHHVLPSLSNSTMRLEDHGLDNPHLFSDACHSGVSSFVLRNISQIYMNASSTLHAPDGQGLYLVVDQGQIRCLGVSCDRDSVDWPVSSPVFNMGGAVILPGIVSMGVPLGLFEVQSEDATYDGVVKKDASTSKEVVRAVDGLKLNGLRLQKAYKAGVTTAIAQPVTYESLIPGLSVGFRTGTENSILDAQALIKEEAALNFVIQHGSGLTVSQQIAKIRDLLISNIHKDTKTNVFARAAQGQLPIVVQVDDKDEIASLLRLKQTIQQDHQRDLQLVILGGSESYLLADHLNRLQVPVILMPARCFPSTWQSRLCLAGPPVTPWNALDILIQHGVQVGLGSTDPDNGDARNLIWEAGWNLAHNTQLTPSQAVGLVTWNMADILGLPEIGQLREGGPAEFVAYNNNPFQFGTQVLMVHGGGRSGPTCFPQQV